MLCSPPPPFRLLLLTGRPSTLLAHSSLLTHDSLTACLDLLSRSPVIPQVLTPTTLNRTADCPRSLATPPDPRSPPSPSSLTLPSLSSAPLLPSISLSPLSPNKARFRTHPQSRLRTRIFGKYLVDHSLGQPLGPALSTLAF
ncbi:hypothetical protein BC827DRAFT_1201579 [Russula dissimulans]|nr:hypothetical protein BC827DRAFT_1201579 [Russula dissimulans]